ncbi:MAG: hypothetical protein P4M01_10835 [Acidobacteriota bacterium]|nr:hypothetical protein [Acidobacteriota bacterium]
MPSRKHLAAAAVFLLATSLVAGTKPAPKNATVVDEGTFGIFQNGLRTATEQFTIQQYATHSTTSVTLTAEGKERFEQSCELTMLPDGTFSHYEWKETAPEKSTSSVELGDQVLILHSSNEDGKAIKDQQFFLTPATFILDDYFFSTREVLLWRYLASSCRPASGGMNTCNLARQRVPILVPRQRLSAQVFIEFKGYEDMPLNGHPEHLRHFVIETDGPEWHLWMNEEQKVLRISIPSANTEILRQ